MGDQQHPSDPIKQHYVPRFYLHRFRSNTDNQDIDKSHIHCFDKRLGRTYTKNIKEVAYLPRMYDVTYDDGTTGSVEQDLAVWEGESRESIDMLVRDGWDELSKEHHRKLARFVALQLYRTDEIRKRLKELSLVMGEIFLLPADDGRSVGQALELLLRDLQEEQDILVKKTWIVRESGSSLPLWISDVPVTRYSTPRAGGISNVAIGAPGLKLYLPLSPSLGLELCEPGVRTSHASIGRLSAAEVDFRNRLQVVWSRQFVFSSKSDFQRAEEMVRNDPSLGDPDRPTPGLEESARRRLGL